MQQDGGHHGCVELTEMAWQVVDVAPLSIPTSSFASWAFIKGSDPDEVYSSGALVCPAWATKVEVECDFYWDNGVGTCRYVRISERVLLLRSIRPPANSNRQFKREFEVAAGQSIDVQVYQDSGGDLNLFPSTLKLLFT
jgi:hypothetical protein